MNGFGDGFLNCTFVKIKKKEMQENIYISKNLNQQVHKTVLNETSIYNSNFSRLVADKVKQDSILIFDMDGTLIDTDFANYISYNKAIQFVLHNTLDIPYNKDFRFNKKSLQKLLPTIGAEKITEIVHVKNYYYKQYLYCTQLIPKTFEIVKQYCLTHQLLLVTKAKYDRALQTLQYHGVDSLFDKIVTKPNSLNAQYKNKYDTALQLHSLNAEDVIVFENEKTEINDALLAGINKQNIIKIK
jgi:beta-phosphoglucomutase